MMLKLLSKKEVTNFISYSKVIDYLIFASVHEHSEVFCKIIQQRLEEIKDMEKGRVALMTICA